ncbi:MAG: amidohydrolase family protein, partial [Chryseolinea sp.]
ANKPMLKRAGITGAFIKTLPPDEQKYFGLNQGGEPNGLIAESGFEYINKVMPASPIQWPEALSTGMKHLNSLGITAWMDPSAGSIADGLDNTILAAYSKVSKQPGFSAHVTALIRADGNLDPTAQINLAKQWRSNFADNKFISIVGFKIFADGVMEFPTQTASMSLPYKNSGLQGSQMVDPEKFKQFVVAADREKLLVHIHAIGDRAVTDALDAIEAARKSSENANVPHSITHLQCVNPKDLDRFKTLNVPVSMQLLWATKDVYTEDLVRQYIDPTLYEYMYPAKSILNHGGIVAGASDWSVSSANPFEAIAMAETRVGKDGVLNAAEIMSRNDMIKAYTISAAKVILLEKSIGSLEVGKQADLVLLDRDFATVSSESVKDTKVLWTIFGGKVVYRK